MTHPKRLDSYDPMYLEMFTRASEGREFVLECYEKGKATYLTQRLRAYRKLLLERADKDKSLLPAVAIARMVEIGQDGSRVIVRQTGNSWASQLVSQALMKDVVAVPETRPVEPKDLDQLIGPTAPPKGHGYY